MTRFRGMISTQPGSTPVSSFKILSLDDDCRTGSPSSSNDCGNLLRVTGMISFPCDGIIPFCTGPYGEQDDEQLFVQQLVPDSDQLYVRLASIGKR